MKGKKKKKPIFSTVFQFHKVYWCAIKARTFQKECWRTSAHTLAMHCSLEIYMGQMQPVIGCRHHFRARFAQVFFDKKVQTKLICHRTTGTHGQFHHHQSRTPPGQVHSIPIPPILEKTLWLQHIDLIIIHEGHHWAWTSTKQYQHITLLFHFASEYVWLAA